MIWLRDAGAAHVCTGTITDGMHVAMCGRALPAAAEEWTARDAGIVPLCEACRELVRHLSGRCTCKTNGVHAKEASR